VLPRREARYKFCAGKPRGKTKPVRRRRDRGGPNEPSLVRFSKIVTMMPRPRILMILPLIAACTPALAAADIELGRHLARECMTCHRSATPTSTIPSIFGMAETAFAEVVKAYRDKRLANDVMQNIAGRLKDDEIEALAAYFARTKRP
jgi:cytochrome c553